MMNDEEIIMNLHLNRTLLWNINQSYKQTKTKSYYETEIASLIKCQKNKFELKSKLESKLGSHEYRNWLKKEITMFVIWTGGFKMKTMFQNSVLHFRTFKIPCLVSHLLRIFTFNWPKKDHFKVVSVIKVSYLFKYYLGKKGKKKDRDDWG